MRLLEYPRLSCAELFESGSHHSANQFLKSLFDGAFLAACAVQSIECWFAARWRNLSDCLADEGDRFVELRRRFRNSEPLPPRSAGLRVSQQDLNAFRGVG